MIHKVYHNNIRDQLESLDQEEYRERKVNKAQEVTREKLEIVVTRVSLDHSAQQVQMGQPVQRATE